MQVSHASGVTHFVASAVLVAGRACGSLWYAGENAIVSVADVADCRLLNAGSSRFTMLSSTFVWSRCACHVCGWIGLVSRFARMGPPLDDRAPPQYGPQNPPCLHLPPGGFDAAGEGVEAAAAGCRSTSRCD